MTVSSALSIPIRTHLVSPQYLKTFDADFHVYTPPPLRDYSPQGPDLVDYRARVQVGFEGSKGMLVDEWA